MFFNYIISFIAFFIINFVGFSSRIKKINYEILQQEKIKNKNIIYAFWHGRQFLLVFLHRFKKICIMTSYSRDGDLQTKILSKFGYILVRGSTGKKGAVKSTLELIKALKQGYDVAFAVDGPAGPAFKVKPGVIYLAQKTQKVIIPLTSSAKNKKILNNWDRYLVPFPFNDCRVVYGKPVYVNKDDSIEHKCFELQQELNRITNLADGNRN